MAKPLRVVREGCCRVCNLPLYVVRLVNGVNARVSFDHWGRGVHVGCDPEPAPGAEWGATHRVIGTGSRYYHDIGAVRGALVEVGRMFGRDTELMLGACPTGFDELARQVWSGWRLPLKLWPAAWDVFGKDAGPLRNSGMIASGAELVVAAPRGPSVGTRDCVRKALAAGIPVLYVSKSGALSDREAA